MKLTQRQKAFDPFRELEQLSSRMHHLYGLTRWPGGNGEGELLSVTDWSPSCDISETDKEYRIRAELPEVKKSDVHVTLESGVLTIQGERRQEKEEKSETFHCRELAYGSFLRRFTMPEDADEAKVDATFKDGMLDIVVGKSQTAKASKAKEISIH